MSSLRALMVLGLAGLACDSRSPPPAVQSNRAAESTSAGSPASTNASAPRVALISTVPGARESELRFQPLADTLPVAAVARVPHVADGDARGVVLPGHEVVLAIADAGLAREPSFGSWLFRLEPGHPARALATSCFHASRPLVTRQGRVFVERGSAGPAPSEDAAKAGMLRVDALEVDEVDPDTGSLRPVHTMSGYTAHLAASTGDEIVLYRVGPQHADLVAVDVDTGGVRTLAAEIPAFARDFSVDEAAHALVYANHDAAGWLVERLDLATGDRAPLTRSDGMWAAPHVWPGGGLLINDRSGSSVSGGRGFARPSAAGFDELSAVSADSGWAALLHTLPSQFPSPFVVEVSTGAVKPIATPARTRTSIAGFLP